MRIDALPHVDEHVTAIEAEPEETWPGGHVLGVRRMLAAVRRSAERQP
ncbi:hypothetical protein [Micromonospora taraxaci]